MGIRGFEWAIYVDDLDARWLMRVDADYFADPDRGWSSRTAEDTQIWPQGWQPRKVEGLEDSGRRQFTRVGSPTAALWVRSATSFTVIASDAQAVAATVIRYWAEKRLPGPPPLP